jgi:hypothetical protein
MGSIKTLGLQMRENPVNVYGQNSATFFHSVVLFLCWEIDACMGISSGCSEFNNLS